MYLTNESQRKIEPLDAIGAMATMISRQEVQRLPEFSGDERDWPYFEEVYYQTTSEGRYSEAQNVKRLRKALKSPALDLVRDLLMFSADASEIMTDLRETYGRPEKVISTMLEDLLNLKSPKDQREDQLGEFAVKLKNFVASVKTMRMDSELNSEIHIGKIAAKLSDDCYREWRKIKLIKPRANLEALSKFLMERLKLIPPVASRRDQHFSTAGSDGNSRSNRNPGRLMTHHHQDFHRESVKEMPDDCLICLKRHATVRCYKLLNADVKGRLDLARRYKICLSCLSSDRHGMRECKSAKRCDKRGCEKYHHPLIHLEDIRPVYHANQQGLNAGGERSFSSNNSPPPLDKRESADDEKSVPISNSRGMFLHNSNAGILENPTPNDGMRTTSSTLFKVVPVKLYGNNNVSISTYAFLDGGSSVTLLEKELYDKLELEGTPKELVLQWTKGQTRSEHSFEATILLSGVKDGKLHKLRNVNTVKNLCLPAQTINAKELKERHPHLRNIPITDMTDAKPELLIGIQHSKLLVNLKCHLGENDEDPVAIKTELGWVVFGKTAPSLNLVALNQEAPPPSFQFHMTEPRCMGDELHQLVRRFFTTEEFGVAAPKNGLDTQTSHEDRRAQDIINNTMRMVGKRMEIGLFWKTDDVELPSSYAMAAHRLKSQEKSLFKQPEILAWTNDHIKEMVEKGHARIATVGDLHSKWKRIANIPTFTVINKNKVPPKPRFVMDFAAKSGPEGKSVNSLLLKGPDNLAPLLSGLCKFREGRFAVNADVKEMYHQVLIKEEDQQCQRFLWRDGNPKLEPTIYVLQVMAFGPTCSPSAAQAVKNFNAEKFRKECPEAVESIIKHTYVDDYFNSHNEREEALRVTNDAIKFFDAISFPLVGIQSNDKELIAMLPEQNVKANMKEMEIDGAHDLVAKVLGMYWEPRADVFTFKLLTNNMIPKMIEEGFHPTKREILSTIMKIFDPLGLVSHYLIRAKILLQEIWRDGTEWDEKINSRLLASWREWLTQLLNIEKLKIPRQYAPVDPQKAEVQLFVFADASEMGFAATAYFRFDDKGSIHTAHVMSKTRVAPLKQLSIPKLELQAAVLAVRLAQTVKSMHSFPIRATLYATDSKVVLSWITSEKLKLSYDETRLVPREKQT